MKKHKFALHCIGIIILLFSLIACDKDFINLESDVVTADNATNFGLDSLSYDIITYTQPLGPVQTNGLDVNGLGIYSDAYGRTTANFLTQLNLSSADPEFGDGVEIDSVVLYLPYFATVTQIDALGNATYELDSVFNTNPIRLRIFESSYFLRDFDPNGDFDDGQPYFSNKSASLSEMIDEETQLQGEELQFFSGSQTSHLGFNLIEISNRGLILEETDINDPDAESQIIGRLSPGIRIKLNPQFWEDKIISQQGTSVLASQNNFNNYFRGLYFKSELGDNSGSGSYAILNTGSTNANITIYYSRLTNSDDDEEDARERDTYSFSFGPQRINFFDNDFNLPLNQGDDENGDDRLFLKGGEGAIARIKLFEGENSDDDPDINAFEEFRNFFVEENEEGDIISKRLINEANLVFFVDQEMVGNVEPDRLYVYDIDNKTPLADYNLDVTNNSIPSLSKTTHLGPLQRVDDEPNGNGIKYKLRITNHILNLLLNNTTNVELGLAVSLNVNSENPLVSPTQQKVLTDDDSDLMAPISSVMSPKGTVLHGNASEDDSKRVYLEIFYAEPNN